MHLPCPGPDGPLRAGPLPPPLPPPAPTPPVAHELPATGAFDVRDEDILKGDKAATDGPGLLEFFRRHAVQPGDDGRIKGLVRQLGDDDFDRREDASLQLTGFGLRARPFLQNAVFSPDVEVAHRARECLKQIDESSSAAVMAAAVRVLAKLKPEGATAALLDYLPSAGDESLAEGVRLALSGLAVRDGKADAALVGALSDRSAEKRGAAAYALGRAAVAEQLPAVRKLLHDSDPIVRYRAALGLAAAHDKDSVPVLIALLGELPPPEAGRVEELLYRIADDKAPPAPASSDLAVRHKYRDAWKAWWDDNGAKVDDAKLGEAARTLGYTLVILLDQGRVLELDSANQTRLEVEQLEFPLDAQMLPGDHVLTAEHGGNRVTERDAKGKVILEYKIDGPLAAQRLPNGNTFIATRTRVVEVKPNGEELYGFDRPNGEIIMKAQKLANGDIAMVVQAGDRAVRAPGPQRQGASRLQRGPQISPAAASTSWPTATYWCRRPTTIGSWNSTHTAASSGRSVRSSPSRPCGCPTDTPLSRRCPNIGPWRWITKARRSGSSGRTRA